MSNKNSERDFTIENNIITGIKQTYDIKEKSIGEIILKVFNENPDHVGQIEAETGRQTTFKEMKENSIRCALWMQKKGIKSGDVIGLCTHNHLDTYIPFVATFLVGATQNPWYPEMNLKSARYFMNLTKPKVMFACESAIDILTKAAKLENNDVIFIVFGRHSGIKSLKDIMIMHTKKEVHNFRLQETNNSESIALLLFSSGTTGMPKGVQLSYNSVLQNLIAYLILNQKNSKILWYSPLYWISGTLLQFQSILTVSTRILHSKFDPEETCKYIEKFKIDVVFFGPTMITYLCKSNALKKYDLSSINMAITGGAKLSFEILEEFKKTTHISIIQAYGMTEVGRVVTLQTNKCKSIESVGFVSPNVQIKIIDLTNKQTLGPNQPGELCIKSATKMVGYLNNLTATKETIDDEDWIHSGDIAYYSENGEIFIIDRIKEVMKVAGHHISPSELEEVLMSHPAVMEAVVVPVPHKLYIEQPMAFIKKVPGVKVTEAELIKLTSDLDEYKTLTGGVEFVEEIPHTASGKINRKEVKEMAKIYAK